MVVRFSLLDYQPFRLLVEFRKNYILVKKSLLKKYIWATLIVFLGLNLIAFFHAYKFTHFVTSNVVKTSNPKKLSFLEKGKTALFGVNNPRPINKTFPTLPFETILLKSNVEIECWHIKTINSKGTVILFHGFGGEKSSLIDKSSEFLKLGYNTLLVDFMGSGGSEGIQTTIGFKESEQVKTSFEYLVKEGEENIYLFGTSMGAVAIMKAIDKFKIKPKGIIIECPFGSMYKTVSSRFKIMNVPTFPMASLLVFWGGIQNGFWAFSHNPIEYAKNIDCPTLLMYGEKDKKVSRDEIDEIFSNLANTKKLVLYANSGHENYLIKHKKQWILDIKNFVE